MYFDRDKLIEALPQSNHPSLERGLGTGLVECWQTYFCAYQLQDLLDSYCVDIDCLRVNNNQTVYQYYRQPVQAALAGCAASNGVCIIVHGYMDHSGLYPHLIRKKLSQGWDVLIYDLVGHGLSSGEYYAINSFGEYTQQLQDILDFLATKGQSDHWLLIGHSTGCAVIMEQVLNAVWQDFEQIKARVLLAPLLRSCDSWAVKIQYFFLKPFLTKILRSVSSNSHDQQFLTLINHLDPLKQKYIKVNWVGAMLDWEKRFWSYPPSDKHLLIIQGDDDDTVDWRYNLGAIETQFASNQKKIIAGAKHHLTNESYALREEVLQALNSENKV